MEVPPDLLQLIPPQYRSAHLVGNSEEEIAKWKADRRKNFPTEQVISRKRALEDSREQRGQLAQVEPMGAMRRRQDGGSGVGAASAAAASSASAAAAAAPAHRPQGADDPPDELPTGRESAPQLPAVAPALHAPRALQRGDARPPCAAWRARGHCRFGASCRYAHGAGSGGGGGGGAPQAPASAPGSLPAVCRWYLMGVCTAGKRCPYQHALAGGAPGAGPGTEATGLLRRLLAKDVQRESSMVLQGIRALLQRFGGSGGGGGAGGSSGSAGGGGAEGSSGSGSAGAGASASSASAAPNY